MAKSITKDPNKIALNDQYYTLKSPLRAQYVSRMPGKVNIGPDSYDREQMLSNWNIKDLRAGLGREEMDEKVDFDRYWWGNLICDFEGHILLPREATEITGTGTGWAIPSSFTEYGSDVAWNNQNNAIDASVATKADSDATAVNDKWTNKLAFPITALDCNSIIYYTDINVSAWDVMEVYVLYDAGWHEIYNGVPTVNAWTTINIGSTKTVSSAYIRFQHNGTESDKAYLSGIYFGAVTPQTDYSSATEFHFANFNGKYYMSANDKLYKMDANRNFSRVRDFTATIKALIPSLNNRLYIYLGDSTNYYYMSTSDFMTASNSANAYWAFQYDNKLFKVNSSGACAYSTDPDGATPTWTSIGSITDIASQIARFFVGKDASGEEVVCCATKSWFKVLAIGSTFANSVWVNTAVKLPDHPNGGKGACYWHGAHYISYGLGVKKYVSGSTATITEVGLNKDDGLPVEFNGEIVKFGEDSAMDVLFALVDASQTSGNSKSGLYAYTGMGWRCWWYDSANNGAMYDVMVSSAESEYAVYWVCGGSVFYIDIHRGISNPKQLAGTQKYESAGILISPIFDADAAAMKKLIKRVRDYAKSVTTTETIIIYYRIDRATQDVDLDLSGSHWTILADLDTTAEAGEVTTEFASGAGVAVNAIQFRIDMARGGTNTLSPDLQSMVTSYRKLTKGNWVYTAPIVIDGLHNRTKKEQHEDLESAAISETDVALIYRSTAKYVQVMLPQSWKQTGTNYGGEYTLSLIEA